MSTCNAQLQHCTSWHTLQRLRGTALSRLGCGSDPIDWCQCKAHMRSPGKPDLAMLIGAVHMDSGSKAWEGAESGAVDMVTRN